MSAVLDRPAEAAAHPLAVRMTPFIPHVPHPRQHAFLWLSCFEALYGGAAGGGKSDALLMGALQYVDQPHYNAIIFRRTFPALALPGAIMDRSQQWLRGTGARWNDTKHTWRFPSGATLTFAFLLHSTDRFIYQGTDFHYVAFDELTQFPDEDDYLYLASRLRKVEGDPIPLRLRAASNPGGVGHRWVKRRYIDRLPRPDDPEDTAAKCRERVFIPAKLADNPSLDQSAYRAALGLLDPQTRLQLLDGDWSAREPGDWVYDALGIDAAVELGRRFDAEPPPASGDEIMLGIDWGEHSSAVVLVPLEAGGVWVSHEVVERSAVPSVAADRMLDACSHHPYPVTSARFDAAGIQSMRQFMATAKTRGLCNPQDARRLRWSSIPFGKYKEETISYLRLLFSRVALGESTRVIAISPRCDELVRQLRALQFADPDAGKVLKRDDHGPDALVAGAAPIAARHRATVESLKAAA